MAELQHTPEPWEVSTEWGGRPRLAIRNKMPEPAKPGDSTHEIAYISGYLGATVANARRIVACVNACKGMTIEKLEMAVKLDRGLLGAEEMMRDDCNLYLTQRDHLTHLLDQTRDALARRAAGFPLEYELETAIIEAATNAITKEPTHA